MYFVLLLTFFPSLKRLPSIFQEEPKSVPKLQRKLSKRDPCQPGSNSSSKKFINRSASTVAISTKNYGDFGPKIDQNDRYYREIRRRAKDIPNDKYVGRT